MDILPKQRSGRRASAAMVLVLFATGAHASVTISSGATANMSCVSGVCTPTAADAVLNSGDLQSMLGSSNVTVNTGGALASNIDVKAAVTWASSNGLTLDAYQSLTVEQPVADNGTASLTLLTNDGGAGGSLSFPSKGSISFLGTSNALTINGQAYMLENNLASLSAAIASNPAGLYALASSYDASPDGTYDQSPVTTKFVGMFEGLGNAISNLAVSSSSVPDTGVGLFSEVDAGGTIRDLHMQNVDIAATGTTNPVGGLAGKFAGTAFGDTVSGQVRGRKFAGIGGLAGVGSGNIDTCSASAKVTGGWGSIAGGLVGEFGEGTLSNSFATGAVKAGPGSRGQPGYGGGLIGALAGTISEAGTISDSFAEGPVTGGTYSVVGGLVGATEVEFGPAIMNSYATGAVVSGENSVVGGLVGGNDSDAQQGAISASYSTGSVSGGTGSAVGGLIGYDDNNNGGCGCFTDLYWDTTTSGITNLSQGAGNIPNDPGITGDTTAQLEAKLPKGFDKTVWKENPGIDGGLPYLIANPPPKKK